MLNVILKWILLLCFSVILTEIYANIPGGGTGTGANVTLTDNGTTITLDNGIVSITVNKTNALISTFNYKSMNLFAGGTGGGSFYWTWNMPNFSGPNGTCSIITNPSSNSGNYAEICIHSPWDGDTTHAAMDVYIYYSLARGNQGYYAAATLSHPANYPSNPGGEWRCNTYVGSMFNLLSIDSLRNYFVPTIADVAAALPVAGAPKEVTLMTSGIYSGKYFCKYSLSADLSSLKTWGWTSESKHVGIWMTVPSHEYYNGGPMKRELIGHHGNTLLNMLGGQHYSMGNKADMDSGVVVEKTFGPFLVYVNSYSGAASDPVATVAGALWKDAQVQADAEQAAWPYTWFKNAKYVQASGRGTLTGVLNVADSGNATVAAKDTWIGLAPESNGTPFQYQQNTYQYWVKTDQNGNFTIPKIIAGTYNLYAFGGGNIGEFKQAKVVITAAKTLNLGTITWTVPRIAPTVWEIGVSNRDSKEFKNGDFNYTQWQNYMNMPTDYPNGVNYTVGTSNYAKDWNYGLRDVTSWNINFNLFEAPFAGSKVSLYLALASNYYTRFNVVVNGTTLISIGPGNGSDALIRLGSHGAFWDTHVDIPANLLKKGANTIVLSQTKGEIEFDYLRLEATIPKVAVTLSGSTSFCQGNSVTLTASTGKSYRWFNGTTILPTITQSLTVSTSGNYKVEVTNNLGVIDSSDVYAVIANPLPTITSYIKVDAGTWKTTSNVTVCEGSTVNLGPSPTNATGWNWSGPNNFTSAIRTPVLATVSTPNNGLYSVTYTDANGCKANATITVNVSVPTATISSPSNSFCAGSSLLLTANSGNSYKWDNGATQVGTTSTLPATTAGSYTVAVTNANNCIATSNAKVVTINPLPTITPYSQINTGGWNGNTTQTLNEGSTLTFGPLPNVANGWKWIGPNGFTSTLRTPVLNTISPTNEGTYTVIYSDANTCITTANYTISVLTLQSIALVAGWNLISTNVYITDSCIATLFKNLDVQEIKTMNAFWRKGQNVAFNSLKSIGSGKGYLVYMNVAGTLNIYGRPSVETQNFASLQNGWQLIGCPYKSPTAISTIFNSTNCKMVKNLDGFWVPNGTLNSFTNIDKGKGYFIKK